MMGSPTAHSAGEIETEIWQPSVTSPAAGWVAAGFSSAAIERQETAMMTKQNGEIERNIVARMSKLRKNED
jgi:hypothetical protein